MTMLDNRRVYQFVFEDSYYMVLCPTSSYTLYKYDNYRLL